MNLFERYLSLWVALCIVAGIALGHLLPGLFATHCRRGGRAGQPAGGRAGLADDHPDAAEDRLRRAAARCASTGAASASRCSSTGRSSRSRWRCWAGSSSAICSRHCCRRTQISILHRRADPAGRGALHGDGVRVVEPVRRRAAFHAEPGRAQRRHHGVRVRADRRPAARLSRRSRCRGRRCCCRWCCISWCRCIVAQLWRRALLAQRGPAALHADAAARCSRSRWWRCWPRWCCCSASRASRSSPSRW